MWNAHPGSAEDPSGWGGLEAAPNEHCTGEEKGEEEAWFCGELFLLEFRVTSPKRVWETLHGLTPNIETETISLPWSNLTM